MRNTKLRRRPTRADDADARADDARAAHSRAAHRAAAGSVVGGRLGLARGWCGSLPSSSPRRWPPPIRRCRASVCGCRAFGPPRAELAARRRRCFGSLWPPRFGGLWPPPCETGRGCVSKPPVRTARPSRTRPGDQCACVCVCVRACAPAPAVALVPAPRPAPQPAAVAPNGSNRPRRERPPIDYRGAD